MRHKHKPAAASDGRPDEFPKEQSDLPPAEAGPEGPPADAIEAPPGGALVEPLEQEVERLAQQVAEWKDRAMRQAADLDNYRRRAVRERDEWAARAAADVLKRVLEVVDDLARVAHLDPAGTPAESLHEGMLAIERKFQKVLEASGVERIDPLGAAFDPAGQEAVSVMPAMSPDDDNKVGAVFQPGYRLKGTLLRPARVAVLKWSGPTPPADVVN